MVMRAYKLNSGEVQAGAGIPVAQPLALRQLWGNQDPVSKAQKTQRGVYYSARLSLSPFTAGISK